MLEDAFQAEIMNFGLLSVIGTVLGADMLACSYYNMFWGPECLFCILQFLQSVKGTYGICFL